MSVDLAESQTRQFRERLIAGPGRRFPALSLRDPRYRGGEVYDKMAGEAVGAKDRVGQLGKYKPAE